MRLKALQPETVPKAIGLYQEIAYGTSGRQQRRCPDVDAVEGKDCDSLLSLFQKEQVEPVPGFPCVRYSLRLGNRNYPFMKLVLQEHLVAGEFYFAVDTHDQLDIKPDYPDYESWMAVKRFNRDLKQQIELAFVQHGLDTASCLRRALTERCGEGGQGGQGGSQPCTGLVLIVDDEEDLADAVELLLRQRGFRTFTLQDSRCALKAAPELQPDLVLLDYEMPELDGLQVIAQLRGDPATKQVPILLSSAARVSLADIRRADGFLAKPFQEGLLYDMVDRLLRTRPVRQGPR